MKRNRLFLSAALTASALVAAERNPPAPNKVIYVTDVKIGDARARYEDIASAAIAP